MSERTPSTSTIRHAWAKAHPFPLTTEVEERYAEFDRWLAGVIAEKRAEWEGEQGKAEDNANITPEGIEVKPGQRWRSLDKRENGRTVTVESVKDGKARVTNGVTRSTISVKRMRRMSTGWVPVNENGESDG